MKEGENSRRRNRVQKNGRDNEEQNGKTGEYRVVGGQLCNNYDRHGLLKVLGRRRAKGCRVWL